jgi:hypothetical protein
MRWDVSVNTKLNGDILTSMEFCCGGLQCFLLPEISFVGTCDAEHEGRKLIWTLKVFLFLYLQISCLISINVILVTSGF